MRVLERIGRVLFVLAVFGVASYFALQFGSGGLWRGLEAAHAVTAPGAPKPPYDLTQLVAVNETLKTIRDKYVDPDRVAPRQMFLNALNQVQKEVAQVIVTHDEKSPTLRVQVDTEAKEFRVDNVQGPWDVAARLREVFAFLQQNLQGTEVDLQEVEYAACNGMLRTLDPHSVFMSPDAYREMNLTTSGHFGGLGIVISIRDQMLTIMRPMPGTPAGRANLRRLDRITKINDESTLNMPLDDAVARLRGKPGSKVTVWVHRDGTDGWAGSRPFELVREEIQIESVISKALAPGIAYVRIKQFQQSTEAELTRALEGVAGKDRLRGVVIDLRGNGGGLLDQAAKVADKFLDQGVIVSTVGAAEGREEKKASPHDTEPNYPLVVLVNGSAASASEIVAGALKNLDRAVIIGQTTFGKGTVQLVFPRVTPDGAALKLTIAQYLTPGDVSIQGVGVTPDIELDPMTVDTLEMDLYRSEESLRERDLSKSLSNGTKRQERPALTLRYNLPEKERAEWRERGGDLEDEFQLDFPIKFARDLVSKLPVGGRPEQVRAARAIVDKAQAAELATVATDLMGLGVDWSEPPKNAQGPKAGDYAVKLRTDRKGDAVTAGDPMTLEVTVENKGTAPIHQLRAVTKSDSGYYDEKELAFGKIDAGQSRTASVPLGWCETEGRKVGSTKPLPLDAKRVCRLPKDAVTRQDIVKVRFFAAGGEAPPEAEIRPTVTSLPQPAFAYAYYVMDDRPGNGDGQLARGEGATIHLIVKNIGKGRSHEDTQANLRNLTGDGVLLHAGRFDLSNLKPGEVKELDFTFDVLDRLSESFVKLEISVTDRDLRVGSSEKLSLPVIKGGTFVDKAGGRVGVRGASASVAGQPIGSARAFGELEKGAVVERLGKVGEFTKISLGGNRWGFVESKLLDETQAPLRFAFKPWLSRSPPLLDVKPAQLATTGDRVKIEASVTDADRVLDAYVFVGSNKVFYQSNRKSAEPTKLSFSHEALLKPGINVITVVARESEDVASRTTMVVRRDGPNGEALPTPKSDLFGADWEFGAESE